MMIAELWQYEQIRQSVASLSPKYFGLCIIPLIYGLTTFALLFGVTKPATDHNIRLVQVLGCTNRAVVSRDWLVLLSLIIFWLSDSVLRKHSER